MGQRGDEVSTQLIRLRRRPGCDDVADELGFGALTLNGGHGVTDAGVGGQRGLDLAELDPVPAELDLVIGAAEIHELALPPSGPVTGAIHPRPPRHEGVGDEPLRGQLEAVVVAPGEAVAGDPELAGHAGRDELAWSSRM